MLLTLALLAQVHSTTFTQPAKLRHIRMLAQVHRVWDPATGRQMGVVPFALANDFMLGIRDSARFDVDLRGSQKGGRAWVDSTTHFSALLRPQSPRMAGVFYLPLPSKPAKWRVTGREPAGRAEKHVDLPVSPLAEGSFVLSDLVVGAAGQGVAWQLGDDSIALAPKQIVFNTRSIQLNYQIRSDSGHSGLRTRLLITRVIEATDQDGEVLALGFQTPRVPAGLTLVQREVDASRLPGSRYRLDIEVFTKTGESLGKTTGMIELVR